MVSDLFGAPRSRRRLLWPIVLSALGLLVVGLAFVTSGTGSPLYAEDLREQAAAIARKAPVFQDVLARVGAVDRVELVNVVDEVEAAIADSRDFLESTEAPEEATAAAVLFGLAVDLWEQGVLDLESALLDAADKVGPISTAQDLAVNALLDLRAADRLYAEAVTQLGQADITPPVLPMPEVQFLPSGYPMVAGAATLIGAAGADGSLLELRAELRITNFTTDPPWVVDTAGAVTIEFTEALTFKVVVSNDGNTQSSASEVTLEIVGGDGSNQSFAQPVEALEPGVSTTVSFAAVAVSPSVAYQVAARLPLAEGELETDDNARTQRFTINEPTPTTTTTEANQSP